MFPCILLCGTQKQKRSVSIYGTPAEKSLCAASDRFPTARGGVCNFPNVLPVFLFGTVSTMSNMANTFTPPSERQPDWRQREKQRRMNRYLIFLCLVMALIAFYYYSSYIGNVGAVNGLNFDTADHIAFVRADEKGNTTLYAVRVDGTDLRALTPATDVSNKAQPVWTRDGKSLLYASNLLDSKITQIYLLGSGSPKQLTYGPGTKSSPAVSPDGKTAAFIVQGAVKTVNLNGTDVLQLMPLPNAAKQAGEEGSIPVADFEGPFLTAGFASDGIGLAGVQDVSQHHLNVPNLGPFDQAVMALPSNSAKTIPVAFGHEVDFAWEPNGSRLACSYTELEASDTPGAKMQLVSGIRIIGFKDPNKPDHIPLFAGEGYTVEPKHIAWSPTGKKLAFELWRLKSEGVRELRGIVFMDVVLDAGSPGARIQTAAEADGLQSRIMIPAGVDGLPQNPRWSPDGSRLLYESVRSDGKRDLWIINADGTNKFNLTKGVGDNYDGVWSPAQHKS